MNQTIHTLLLLHTRYGVANTRYCVANTRYGVADARYCVADTRYGVAGSRYSGSDTKYDVSDTIYSVADTRYSAADTLLFVCSCVCFCLYGPFNCILFHKSSRPLSAFSLCSTGLISALLVLSTIYLVSLSHDKVTNLCGLLGLSN